MNIDDVSITFNVQKTSLELDNQDILTIGDEDPAGSCREALGIPVQCPSELLPLFGDQTIIVVDGDCSFCFLQAKYVSCDQKFLHIIDIEFDALKLFALLIDVP